jgi:hypothetical protein
MWNTPRIDILKAVPRLYETEHINLKDKIIHLHFFIGGCDWFIAEFDFEDILWGYAILNNDMECAEWGYMSLQELKSIIVNSGVEVDFDLHWKKRPASQIEKICKGMRWIEPQERKELNNATA